MSSNLGWASVSSHTAAIALVAAAAALCLACTSESDGDDDDGQASGGSTGTGASGAGGEATGGSGGGSGSNYCEARSCGADHEAGDWCGSACPKGEGCSEAGQCGAWPPHIDTFYNGHEGWQLPPCDTGDDPGANLEVLGTHNWVKTMRTVATDCPDFIQELHPMIQPGNVATEDTAVPAYGSCVKFYDEQWGTAHEGVVVWGASWLSSLSTFVYRINWRAIIDHNQSPATGIGIAHLTMKGDRLCSIEMEVDYESCPEDRSDCGNHPAPF